MLLWTFPAAIFEFSDSVSGGEWKGMAEPVQQEKEGLGKK